MSSSCDADDLALNQTTSSGWLKGSYKCIQMFNRDLARKKKKTKPNQTLFVSNTDPLSEYEL